MRKILSFVTAFLLFVSVSAQPQRGSDFNLLNKMKVVPTCYTPDAVAGSVVNYFPGQHKDPIFSVIGNTYFDTQTYNSGNLMSRIYMFDDQTIGATWMHVGESGTPDRGTAYNYFDGTSWGEQDPHIGAALKTGFPSYAAWGPNGEVVAHYQYIGGDGPIVLLRREQKGVGEWQESLLQPPAGYHSLVWHSMTTSGENHEFIHLLGLVYDDPYLGQDDALLYYRSSDGGVTWDINGVVIDGLGADFFPSISSLHYSWAQPVGNTLAFTFGFNHFDGLVFKSTDNGTTWQKIVVYDSPFDPLNVPSVINTFGGCDGTSAIALDSEGKAHVAFGRMLWSRDASTWYYSPLGTEGLMYWNEDMPALDTTAISSYTLANLQAGGNLIGWIPGDVTIVNGQPDYGLGLTSQPQIAISPTNELSVVFTSVAPSNMLENYYYRHIYFVRSLDGGATWSEPYDLNQDMEFSFSECVFPGLAPLYDDKLHLIFQEDFTPGTGTGFGLGEENFMRYLQMVLYTTGSEEKSAETVFEVSQNFPNPAHDETQVCVKLSEACDINIQISDLAGKVLKTMKGYACTEGQNYISIDIEGLNAGVYSCTVSNGVQKESRKLIVK